MTALQLLQEELKDTHKLFNDTIADITEDQLHIPVSGKALPLGATFAHLVFSEDVILQGMVRGQTPLSETTFKGKNVVSEPMPAMDEDWSVNNEKWARSVKINLDGLKEYTKAVFEESGRYFDSLKDEDLEKEIDLGSWGKMKLYYILYSMVIAHCYSLVGEISALKGLQGLKGYPF